MNSIDLTPLYRNSIGFDRFSKLLDGAFSDNNSTGYPPYNILMRTENEYELTIAAAGFAQEELSISVENNILTVKGERAEKSQEGTYLHHGIASRAFERRFNLADHVEVTAAKLQNGLLVIDLLREIPEKMKPRAIAINN